MLGLIWFERKVRLRVIGGYQWCFREDNDYAKCEQEDWGNSFHGYSSWNTDSGFSLVLS